MIKEMKNIYDKFYKKIKMSEKIFWNLKINKFQKIPILNKIQQKKNFWEY